jgi:2-phosphosulfolactate phosphatase
MAKRNPYKFLNHSSHKERLARLNLKKDIKYCLTPNQTKVIPVLQEGVLVNMALVEN